MQLQGLRSLNFPEARSNVLDKRAEARDAGCHDDYIAFDAGGG